GKDCDAYKNDGGSLKDEEQFMKDWRHYGPIRVLFDIIASICTPQTRQLLQALQQVEADALQNPVQLKELVKPVKTRWNSYAAFARAVELQGPLDSYVHSVQPYFGANYIPASTVQLHASNLLQLPAGDLMCAWFGGSQEGLSDICIHSSRLHKGSGIWSAPQKISDDQNRNEQNSVLFLNPNTNDLWILYTAQPAGNQDKAVVRYRVSKDEGQTWSAAQNWFKDEGLFIRQPITVLKVSTWVLPA
ncbi:hypothetical protein EK21DRAFT_67104, partial [Setomelanomma holmii]